VFYRLSSCTACATFWGGPLWTRRKERCRMRKTEPLREGVRIMCSMQKKNLKGRRRDHPGEGLTQSDSLPSRHQFHSKSPSARRGSSQNYLSQRRRNPFHILVMRMVQWSDINREEELGSQDPRRGRTGLSGRLMTKEKKPIRTIAVRAEGGAGAIGQKRRRH